MILISLLYLEISVKWGRTNNIRRHQTTTLELRTREVTNRFQSPKIEPSYEQPITIKQQDVSKPQSSYASVSDVGFIHRKLKHF